MGTAHVARLGLGAVVAVVSACTAGRPNEEAPSQGSSHDGGSSVASGSAESSSTDSAPAGDDAGAARADSAPTGDDTGAARADSAPTGNDGAAAGTVATIGGCPVFPADNAWNTRIDDTSAFPVHPNSATYIASMSPGTHLHPDWGDWSTDHYGIPWQTVNGTQSRVPMTFQYADQSDPGPYPFPATALVEGGSASGGDMHVIVLDTGTCTLYETWDSTYANPGWTCGSGAKFDLTSDALRPDGWTSADAAGLPILPGLVRLSEVEAGAIHHAMRFTVASSQEGYIHPATHAAGSHDATLPPMGLRVRLKAGVDLSTFSGPARVILTAMKEYGMIVADNGSNWYVSGESNDAWGPVLDAVISAFSQVHGSDFEAVDTGPISTAGL
jgi:hypothetical protein